MVRSNKKINMRIGDNMKEIKVKKSRNEDDNYVELWKVIDPMKDELIISSNGTNYIPNDTNEKCFV